jgi:hypothetical protein
MLRQQPLTGGLHIKAGVAGVEALRACGERKSGVSKLVGGAGEVRSRMHTFPFLAAMSAP